MKKRKLKSWVKVALVVIAILIVWGLLKALYLFNEKEVKGCMEYGYTETYCRSAK